MEEQTTGQETLFDVWYVQYRKPIARYISGMLPGRDRSLAEDLTQETFLRVWCALERGCTIDHVPAYFYRAATNVCIDQARRRRSVCCSLEEGDHADQCLLPDPHTEYGEREQIRQALARLPLLHRQALLLCFQEGYSYAQIAQGLKLAPKGIKMFLSRARRRFRQYYREQE